MLGIFRICWGDSYEVTRSGREEGRVRELGFKRIEGSRDEKWKGGVIK